MEAQDTLHEGDLIFRGPHRTPRLVIHAGPVENVFSSQEIHGPGVYGRQWVRALTAWGKIQSIEFSQTDIMKLDIRPFDELS